MNDQDIRWQQRFMNFNKAFEYTYELAWKALQDLLYHKGYAQINGPKPVIQQSFQDGCIADGKKWMSMHDSRNLASHIYNSETAREIIEAVRLAYFALFKELKKVMDDEKSDTSNGLFIDK